MRPSDCCWHTSLERTEPGSCLYSRDGINVHATNQSEVLVLSSHSIFGEALVVALRQAGWDAARFAADCVAGLGPVSQVVVGPVRAGTPESSVTATLGGASTIVLDDSVRVRGATVLPPSANIQDVLAALSRLSRPQRKRTITPRHAQILQHVADGRTVQQAASMLGITSKTVNNHLGSVYRRLDVENLTQAVLRAIRLGFVDASRQLQPVP